MCEGYTPAAAASRLGGFYLGGRGVALTLTKARSKRFFNIFNIRRFYPKICYGGRFFKVRFFNISKTSLDFVLRLLIREGESTVQTLKNTEYRRFCMFLAVESFKIVNLKKSTPVTHSQYTIDS